jgi:hypothetical protein
MKSAGLIAPLLAGSAAARALLDARAVIGVNSGGAVCPVARSDTVLVQPIFYSEFIPYNTVIDPFRNGKPVTVANAPTPIIVLSDFRTTILGGSVTLPGTNTVSATPGATTTTPGAVATTTGTPAPQSSATGTTSRASSASSTPSILPRNLRLGTGIGSGPVNNFPFLALAFANIGTTGTKRDVANNAKRQASALSTALPVNAVDLSGGTTGVNNGFSSPAASCDNATPLALVNGILTNGQSTIAKQNGATQAVLGFLTINLGTGAVNATVSLVNGILVWQPTDMPTMNAAFYNCPDGLWAGFPNLDSAKLAQCVQVNAGAISGSACQQAVLASGRQPNPLFVAPQGGIIPPSSSSTTSTTSTTSRATGTGSVVPPPSTTGPSGNPTTTTTTTPGVVVPTTTTTAAATTTTGINMVM